MSSSVSKMLDTSIEKHVLPIVQRIGMAPVPNPQPPRPGLVARTLSRPLDADRSLVWQCWCAGKTAHQLTWRLDVLRDGIWHDLQLTFPFERIGYPPARPEGGSHGWLQEFHPDRSAERFDRAMAFMGALFPSLRPQLAEQVEELRPELEAAAATVEWISALEAAPRLWATRLLEGAIDPTELPGVVTFAGANMVVVDVSGQRMTFKFPAEGIAKGDAAHVSGWWTTPAGTRSATELRIGTRVWRFDLYGRLADSQ